MYVFYPHTVAKEYGKNFGDIAIEMDKYYDELVENPRVRRENSTHVSFWNLLLHSKVNVDIHILCLLIMSTRQIT